MPFYSKDWRSPGEVWVKTDEGWERLKVLECGKRKRLTSGSDDSFEEENQTAQDVNPTAIVDSSADSIPPHCHITKRCTREIAGFNGLGEAVRRLDFRSSVRDRRRFHYICAFLRLLVAHGGINNLSGSAQRQMLQMVEEVAAYVSDSQQNINVLRGLAVQLQHIVDQESQKCWGKPLGSTNLWLEHIETIKRVQNVASRIQIKEPGPDTSPKLSDLPAECVREIILRIADHRDLESSREAWSLMATLVSEQRIWRELVRFHFNQSQINTVFNINKKKNIENRDWNKIYHQLRRSYGVNDEYKYAEVLVLCRYCCCLYWPSDGHPCIVDQNPDYRQRLENAGAQLSLSEPVLPAQLLEFFSL